MAVRHSSVRLLWRSHAFLFTFTANACLCRGNKMPICVTSGGKGSSLFQRYKILTPTAETSFNTALMT